MINRLTLLHLSCPPAFKITPQFLCKRSRKIPDTPNMHTNILFLRRTSQRERMILPQTNLWTTQKDILSCLGFKVLLPNLYFAYPGGMLNDLGDVCFMSAADFAHQAFEEVD